MKEAPPTFFTKESAHATRIRHIDPDATLGSELSLEALARLLRPEILSEVLEECEAHEQRTRKLPASTMVVVCVAMNLYASECLVNVFSRLVSGLRWLLADPGAWRVSKGALCQARYRLGARPLAALFRRVCAKPLATPTTPGAFLFGLRLMALDGTTLEVADTPENVRAFGKPGTSRGASAWPQVRVVALSECATHAVLDAGVWPHGVDERACRRRLLRAVGEGNLLLWDRGLHSFEMVDATLARGAHLLGRLPATVRPKVLRTLTDGTQLISLRPVEKRRRRRGERVVVRLIRYTLEDPNRPGHRLGHRLEHRLITSLLDPDVAPAEELVDAYHARWEFELAVDEMKTHQHPPHQPLCSEKPVGRRTGTLRASGGSLHRSDRHGRGGARGGVGAEAPELHRYAAHHPRDGPGDAAHRRSGSGAPLPATVGRRRREAFAAAGESHQPPRRQKEDVKLRG